VHAAVHDAIGPGERSLMHKAAALLLAAEAAGPDRVALNLLNAEPAGQPAGHRSRFRRRGSREGQAAGYRSARRGAIGRRRPAELGSLGLEPGYSLLYDMGCIHGLPVAARRGAARGLSELAAPRRGAPDRGVKVGDVGYSRAWMDREDIIELLGDRNDVPGSLAGRAG
jgi:hypothetical protein